MKQKTLILLTLITAVVVVAAVVSMKDDPALRPTEQGPFLVGLKERINDVARLEISSGGTDVVVVKNEEDWALQSSGGYPAKFEVVKAVLLGLTELDRVEGKTSNPESYSKLGVDAPQPGAGSSTQIELFDASGSSIAAIIMGNRKTGKTPEMYAREPDAEQAWLIHGQLNLQMDPSFWIEKEITNIAPDRVASVVIQRSDSAPLRIYKDRPSDANFLIEDIPSGREPISESIANSVASGLNYLSLEEVRPAGEVSFDGALVAKATFLSWDGFVVQVETTRVDDQNWIRLFADTDEAPTIQPDPNQEGEEPAPPVPFDGASPEEIQAEIEKFNSTVGSWAYRVAPYKLSSFEKRMTELLREPKAVEAPENPVEFDAFGIDDQPIGEAPNFEELMNASDEEPRSPDDE